METENYKIIFKILAKYLEINECPLYYVCIHIIIIAQRVSKWSDIKVYIEEICLYDI